MASLDIKQIESASFLPYRRQGHGSVEPRIKLYTYGTLLLVTVVTLLALLPSFFPSLPGTQQLAGVSQIISKGAKQAALLLDFNCATSFYPSSTSVVGPVIRQNFPDPSAVKVGDTWYAFATNNNNNPNVQVACSKDFMEWTVLDTDALPDPGPWSPGQGIWAPDVVQLNNSAFVLYYSAPVLHSPAQHCVGAAISSKAEGPYKPSASPFACPLDIGGAIDADGFFDEFSGRSYVVYKVDGNSLGHGGACNNGVPPFVPTPIYLQEVEADGVTAIGDPIIILDRIDDDGPLIEAPALHVSAEGIYFLFFSSDCYTTTRYDVQYATATDIYGPYVRANKALLTTGDWPNLVAPGGADVASDQGGYMVFHGDVGSSDGRLREMYIARPQFNGHRVTI